MNAPSTKPAGMVGLVPWLPWPLSNWPWWTEPVRAERLALLRIGLCLCLLADIGLNYAPRTLEYFASGSLGDPAIFNWRFQPPRMTWSLLRGVGDGATQSLSLLIWVAMTLWILGNAVVRFLFADRNAPADDRTGMSLWLWTAALVSYAASLWSQMAGAGAFDGLAWTVPLIGFSLACLFTALDIAIRLRLPEQRVLWLPSLTALGVGFALFVAGIALTAVEDVDKTTWWVRLLRPWQDDESLLVSAMALWIASTCFLLVGLGTRLAAITAWLMSMSFANANPYLDNAGDTIRLILLFYLMLCPCGAVWSVDSLFAKRQRPVFVHPWPIRVLFVQLIFVYWMNGLYKLFGASWQEGTSLHYAMGDLALVRFSQVALPLPPLMSHVMTWTVLLWEVTFPLMVLWKWPRRIALFFGVMFHLGIFATMELGGFVPYALCMYLPMIPWGDGKPVSAVLEHHHDAV